MRRVLPTLALGLVIGVAVAACGSQSQPGAAPAGMPVATSAATAGATPVAPAVAPETVAICAEAVMISKANAEAFREVADELRKLSAAGASDAAVEAKAYELDPALWDTLLHWWEKLADLSGETPEPQLNAALINAARTVKDHTDPEDRTDASAAQATFDSIAPSIEAACPHAA